MWNLKAEPETNTEIFRKKNPDLNSGWFQLN